MSFFRWLFIALKKESHASPRLPKALVWLSNFNSWHIFPGFLPTGPDNSSENPLSSFFCFEVSAFAVPCIWNSLSKTFTPWTQFYPSGVNWKVAFQQDLLWAPCLKFPQHYFLSETLLSSVICHLICLLEYLSITCTPTKMIIYIKEGPCLSHPL